MQQTPQTPVLAPLTLTSVSNLPFVSKIILWYYQINHWYLNTSTPPRTSTKDICDSTASNKIYYS